MEVPGEEVVERRSTDAYIQMDESQFRGYITRRLNNQDTKLDEILLLIKFGKIGANVIKWFVAIGASTVAIITGIHNWHK